MSKSEITLLESLERLFPNNRVCMRYLEDCLFLQSGVCCFQCGSSNLSRKSKMPDSDQYHHWQCRRCRTTFNVLRATIFKGTRVPLIKWFSAIYVMEEARIYNRHVTATELARLSQVSRSTGRSLRRKILGARDPRTKYWTLCETIYSMAKRVYFRANGR